MPTLRGTPLVRAWFWTVSGAEFVGFVAPATVGVLTANASPGAAFLALLAAGSIEGSMLGWGQATVLGRAVPGLSRRAWIVATAAAAVLAYAVGLAPSTFASSLTSWPTGAVITAAALLSLVLLGSIGTAQWLVLRHHVAGAARWIATTAVAWLVGLGAFLAFATPLWQPGQPFALILAIGIAGGLLMAATTSAITGMALRRLLSQTDRSDSPGNSEV